MLPKSATIFLGGDNRDPEGHRGSYRLLDTAKYLIFPTILVLVYGLETELNLNSDKNIASKVMAVMMKIEAAVAGNK